MTSTIIRLKIVISFIFNKYCCFSNVCARIWNVLSISKPTYPRSEGLVQDSMWINHMFSPLADGHDQHIALSWFAASQSRSCYLSLAAWNNLPESVVVSDKTSTFNNHWVDHPMRHNFLATQPAAFSD